jgi:peptidoglycan/LPS O-acetylase OafA/YrhL
MGDALGSRDNALNFVRLILAASVIFWHTYPLTGTQPSWPADSVGAWAVNGFFAISGYLISGSRMRLDFWPYMWRRAMRIFPAFWVVLVVTAFIFAPVSTLVSGRPYNPLDGVNYVIQNMALWLGELGVGASLSGVPHPDSWNGSLWTLFFEFGAYIAAGLLLGLAFVRKNMAAVLAPLLIILSVAVAVGFGRDFPGILGLAVPAARLWSFFVAGMLVYTFRDRLGSDAVVGLAAASLFALTWAFGIQGWAGQLPFSVLVLWLGAVLTTRVGVKNDISYGVYIYAFPVQQLLVVFGFSALAGAEWSAVSALALTVPLAFASWRWVERPLQDFSKRWNPERGRALNAKD